MTFCAMKIILQNTRYMYMHYWSSKN